MSNAKRKRDPQEEATAEHRQYAIDYMRMSLNPFEGPVVGYPDFDTSFTVKKRLPETHRVSVPWFSTAKTYRGICVAIEPDDDGLVTTWKVRRAADWNDVKDYIENVSAPTHIESRHKSAQAGNIQRILSLGIKLRVDPKAAKSCTVCAVPYLKDGELSVLSTNMTFEQFCSLKGRQIRHFAAGELAHWEGVCLSADYHAYDFASQLEAVSYSRVGWVVWVNGLDTEDSAATTYDGDAVTVSLSWCLEEQATTAINGHSDGDNGKFSEHALSIAHSVISTIGGALGAFGQGALRGAENVAVSAYNRVKPALSMAGTAAFQYALRKALSAGRAAFRFGGRAAPLLLEAA